MNINVDSNNLTVQNQEQQQNNDALNNDEEDLTNVQVSLQQQNYFSHDGMRNMEKTFKNQARNDMHNVYVGDLSSQSGGGSKEQEDSLLYYGDSMSFEYRLLKNVQSQNLTIDNKFMMATEFQMNDKTQIRVNSTITNKNKQIVGFIYPRMRYQLRPRTQIEAGASIGSIHRQMIGVSQVLNDKWSVGYNVEHCQLRNLFTHSVSAKQKVSQDSFFTTSFVQDSKGKYDVRFKYDKYFDTLKMQESPWLIIKSAQKFSTYLSLQQSRVELRGKTSNKISRRFRVSHNIGLCQQSNQTYLDVENEYKWQVRDHVKFYFGLKYSVDGWSYLYGVKIAGLKVKFPVFYVDHSEETELARSAMKDVKSYALMASLYFGGSYLMKFINDRLDSKKILKWNNTHLYEKKNKQEDALSLIRDKAFRNQNTAKNKLLIMRALYGQKSEIKKYIARFADRNLINDILKPINAEISSEMPYGICDVTIPIRFGLEGKGVIFEKMRTKENILGFYNPIPPFKLEHDCPVLCIIFKRPAQNADQVYINYFRDDQNVEILFDE
eukprot:403336759